MTFKLNRTSFISMRIDHVMISVSNYSETLQWYQDKLNATIEKEWTVDELPDLQLAYLNVSGFRIEVVGTTQPRSGMPDFQNFGEALRTTGIGHFCFPERDIKPWLFTKPIKSIKFRCSRSENSKRSKY